MSPVRGRLVRSLTVLALAVPLVATPTAAQAKYLRHADTRGDIVREGSNSTLFPAPNIVNGDILTSRLRHTDTTVLIALRFADLRRMGDWLQPHATVLTNEGIRRTVYVVARPGRWAGIDFMVRRLNGAPVRCALKHSIDYLHNVLTVGIPRRCLSRPRWVRVAATSGWRSSEKYVYWDDAQADAMPPASHGLTYSGRIYKG